MTALTDVEAAVGIVLIFFLPGYALTKSIFPEWRVRGANAGLRAVEITTLSFVTSVALSVFAGYLLLLAAPGGFQAYWSSPVLEGVLAAIAAVGLVVAWRRGAFSKIPPPSPSRATDAAEEGAWELLTELDRLGRDERRLLHALRQAAPDAPERAQLTQELARVRAEREALQARREDEYAR